MKHPFLLINGVIFSLGLSAAAASADTGYPSFSGSAVFEIQLEHGANSDDPDNERTNTFGRMEVAPKLTLNENMFFDGVLVLEPVRDGVPGEDRFFEDEGVFIEEIKFNYENGPYGVFAGKFNPGFGIAWDYGRGIWSEDFAEDYEITEKLGVGGSYALETADVGTHTVTASTFFSDTSFLTESAVTSRTNVSLEDGGAANTEDFSSFVVSLGGENTGGIENLTYQIAFRHLAEADISTDGKDEQGMAANLGYVFAVSSDIELDTLVEYAGINNFDGAIEDRQYAYASGIVRLYKNWNIALGYTARTIDPNDGSADTRDHLVQITGGYDFGNGLTFEAGWKGTEEATIDTDILGGLARYTVEF